MELTTDHLFKLELRLRLHADSLEKAWPKSLVIDPATPPQTRAYGEQRRLEAREYSMAADLIKGLQGDWEKLGPLVRNGYRRMVAPYNAAMAQPPETTP